MEKQKPETVQKVVRSMVVSLASPQDIYNELLKNNGKQPSLLRFYLGVKGEDKSKRYTLLGGKIRPSEDFPEAIQREISEEAGLNFLGIPEQSIIGQWKYSSPNSGERDIILTYNPVLPSSRPAIGDPKISSIEILRLEELRQLVTDGYLNGVPLENHLAMCDCGQDQIDISEKDSGQRNFAMAKALNWMSHVEDYLSVRFKQLIFRSGSQISEELFTVEYEKVLSEFMRRGLEVAVKRKTNSNAERERRYELVEVLNGGYLGKDILYYLPQLAKHGVNWTGLERATEGEKTFVGFLKQTFADFLQQQGLTEQAYKDIMENDQIPLEQKTPVFNALNEVIKNKLKITFGVNDDDLEDVMGYVTKFFRDISNEIRVADPNLTKGLYQDFTLINEVNNANYGYLLSLFLGFDTKMNSPEEQEIIRYEAGRQLALLLKSLSGITHYKKEIEKIRSGRLQNALTNFFGPILEEQIIELDEKNKMRVRVRKRGEHTFIVDEKPIKSFASFLRKSFEEKVGDIHDFYTVSITFLDGNKDINNGNMLISEFDQFLHEQFPSSQITTYDKRSYGTTDYINSQNNQGEQTAKGKRKGSQGSRFVRTKLFFQLDEERLELIVYPLYSTDQKNNFWGWLETRTDDKDYVVRRLLAEENGISSIYNLLFPSELYPHHYQHKLGSHYYN